MELGLSPKMVYESPESIRPFIRLGVKIMKKLIGGVIAIVVLGLILVVILGSVGMLEGTPLGPVWDRYARGYAPAKTPQECVDAFKKAMLERDFPLAAKYCTAGYAEQLRRGGKGAREMAQKMDDLQYQMKSRGYNTDDTKLLFFQVDPFPTDMTVTVSKESGDEAWATFAFGGGMKINLGKTYDNWNLDPRMFNVYLQGVRHPVKMVKQKDVWLLDFNVDPRLQVAVDRLNSEYKDYVNAYKLMSSEVKNEPTTKENCKGRLRILMEEAARD